jgi:rhamnopyranosyl-N-acetylglucosaminyl-diphospho-decaprenol beta-1,3/1,4-galactofuranosyltransferase
LEAIGTQSLLPDSIVVIDNGSSPPVTDEMYPDGLPPVRLVRSDSNTGPAGGWAIGFRDFLNQKSDLAWVMDDDAVADSKCLAVLGKRALEMGDRTLIFPRWIQPDGSDPRWGAWCGFLISREIVEQVGVPREEFFWWAEDTEYTQIRLPRAGFPRKRAEMAIVHHLPARHGTAIPVWKYYYEARNSTYLHMYVLRRVGRYPWAIAGLIGQAVIKQHSGRVKRLVALARGLFDGVFKRLGIRFPVDGLYEVKGSSGGS